MNAWATLDDDNAAEALGRAVIGAGVRAGRLGLGLSQRQLAWLVGVSQSAISRLETGTLQGLRFRTLARIAGVLKASPGYTFPEGPPPPNRRLPGQRFL
jgi:transcriptional regulator with XRE-family HTH domain